VGKYCLAFRDSTKVSIRKETYHLTLDDLLKAVMKEWMENKYGESVTCCAVMEKYILNHGCSIDCEKWKLAYKKEKAKSDNMRKNVKFSSF